MDMVLISDDKAEEIETEYALKVIDEQKQSRDIIPECVTTNSCESSVALMVEDNIDNLENTTTGSGTSDRVNSILATMKAPETNQEVEEGKTSIVVQQKEMLEISSSWSSLKWNSRLLWR